MDLKPLHAKIGQTDPGEWFFRTRAHQGGIAERQKMIDRTSNLSISRQAELLGFSRGNLTRVVHSSHSYSLGS